MRISEIFYSIEGEGKRAGEPCVFIRKFLCSISCSYCDSQYACVGDDFKEMSVNEILHEVVKVSMGKTQNVTITGGEPLYTDNPHRLCSDYLQELERLIKVLHTAGFYINIETNGVHKCPDQFREYNLFCTYDYKCPSSGMQYLMYDPNYMDYTSEDCLKFVVGTQEDLKCAKSIYDMLQIPETSPLIYLSPVWDGELSLRDITEFMLEQMPKARLNIQLHKLIWDPNMRGV